MRWPTAAALPRQAPAMIGQMTPAGRSLRTAFRAPSLPPQADTKRRPSLAAFPCDAGRKNKAVVMDRGVLKKIYPARYKVLMADCPIMGSHGGSVHTHV